jgi:hypothetical protein
MNIAIKDVLVQSEPWDLAHKTWFENTAKELNDESIHK